MEKLQEQYDEVLAFVKLRRKGAVEFSDLVSKRIKAELTYSKSLQNIATNNYLLNQE